MKRIRDITSRFRVVGEIFSFLWKRKLWWLMPMIFILVGLGVLLVFGQATGVGPFIYALF